MNRIYNIHTIWLAMLALTLSTYAMGKFGLGGVGVVAFLLLTSIVKGSFIIHDFMELRGVSLLWRAIMYGWLWSICLTIFATYLIGR